MLRIAMFRVSLVLVLLSISVRAQGPLTPPGVPGPTMKTLDQIEPRTPITNAIFNISQPGSYYLTRNIDGLGIQSHNITLDLMGYSVAATGGSAIYFYAAYTNVVIRNGTISSTTGNGLEYPHATPHARGLIEQVRISRCQSIGLNLPAGFIVRDCEIYGCPTAGIRANGACEIRNCHLESNGSGLVLTSGSIATDNAIVNNNTGLRIEGTNNVVENNVVKGNPDNYNLAAGNQLNLLIGEIPETLDWPCSVKLAGTLNCTATVSNGITVNANDVTIDLDGHTLVGPGANSGNGIHQADTLRNLSVLNGKVVYWRGDGMDGVYARGKANRINGIQAATNSNGILVGAGGALVNCTAFANDSKGISAGAGCTLGDCSSSYNGSEGFDAYDGTVLSHCSAFNNGYCGIYANSACLLDDCVAAFNVRDGIQVLSDCQIIHCSASNNGNGGDGAGIHAFTSGNRIDGNHVANNDRGIDVDLAGNFIVRNSARLNANNYDIAAGNSVGTITNTPVGAGAWNNFTF